MPRRLAGCMIRCRVAREKAGRQSRRRRRSLGAQSMENPQMPAKAIVLALLSTLVPAIGGASQWYKLSEGSTQRSWLSNSKAATESIVFAWIRDLPTSDTAFYAIGECVRATDAGVTVGSNKVTFRNIRLLGADSDNEASLGAKGRKMKKGIASTVWDITDLVNAKFSRDSWVIVAGQVVLTGSVKSHDTLFCTIGTLEIRDTSALAATGSRERLRNVRQIQRELARRGTAARRPAPAQG